MPDFSIRSTWLRVVNGKLCPGSSAGNCLRFVMFLTPHSDTAAVLKWKTVRVVRAQGVNHIASFLSCKRWKVYGVKTYGNIESLYSRCRSVWSRSGNGKLFISWGKFKHCSEQQQRDVNVDTLASFSCFTSSLSDTYMHTHTENQQ